MIPSMPRVKSAISVPAALMSMFAGVADAHLAGMSISDKVPGSMERTVMTADMITGEATGMMMAARPEEV